MSKTKLNIKFKPLLPWPEEIRAQQIKGGLLAQAIKIALLIVLSLIIVISIILCVIYKDNITASISRKSG